MLGARTLSASSKGVHTHVIAACFSKLFCKVSLANLPNTSRQAFPSQLDILAARRCFESISINVIVNCEVILARTRDTSSHQVTDGLHQQSSPGTCANRQIPWSGLIRRQREGTTATTSQILSRRFQKSSYSCGRPGGGGARSLWSQPVRVATV